MILPALRIGARTPDVGNWQRFLNEAGSYDDDGGALVDDEVFGRRTDQATKRWQAREGLTVTGIVAAKERLVAARQGYIPFVQAKNCTVLWPSRTRQIDVVTIHVMENAETPEQAENVALWFAGLTRYEAPGASCHYNVDQNSVVQSVRDSDVAWHAPGLNHNGIGIEHAGRSRQTPDEWDDEASRAILTISAKLAARLAVGYGIPVVRLSPEDLKAKRRGFAGHVDATKAFPGPKRDHWDPGPSFPWQRYLDAVSLEVEWLRGR